jgi:hypothetical protein
LQGPALLKKTVKWFRQRRSTPTLNTADTSTLIFPPESRLSRSELPERGAR